MNVTSQLSGEVSSSEEQQMILNEDSVSDMMELLSVDVELSCSAADREGSLCSINLFGLAVCQHVKVFIQQDDSPLNKIYEKMEKNVMRKQRNWERRLEAKRRKRKEEKQRRKQSQQEKDFVPQFSKRVIKAITKERLEEARTTGPRLCVDLSMTDCMSHKEISRLAGQIRRLYGSNKKTQQPFHLFLTDMKKDGLLYRECIRMNAGFLNYLIDVTEDSWIELFPSEDIIYLTPDASEALEQVDDDKVYILGGLVDESIQKKISYTRAEEHGVQMARLPIDEYMVKKPNSKNFYSKILAINQVFEILLTYRDTGSWTTALSAGIPVGKGYVASSEALLEGPQ